MSKVKVQFLSGVAFETQTFEAGQVETLEADLVDSLIARRVAVIVTEPAPAETPAIETELTVEAVRPKGKPKK
jgi:hypothetical protein